MQLREHCQQSLVHMLERRGQCEHHSIFQKRLGHGEPEAVVLPVSISHSWKLMKWGNFPMMPGVTMRFTVHEPIPVKEQKASELAARVEQIIVGGIED